MDNTKFLTLIVVTIASLFLNGCAVFVGAGAAGLMVAPDRRSTGTIIDDQTLHIRTQLAISRDKEIRGNSHISATMYNKTLLLVGQANSDQVRAKAFEIAAKIPNIEKIYNEVDIAEPTNYSQRLNDTWITTRVKCSLVFNRDLGPGRVSVTTENGIVYLMGMLSPEEEYAASNAARKVNGVRKVVRLFEPINNSIETPTESIG